MGKVCERVCMCVGGGGGVAGRGCRVRGDLKLNHTKCIQCPDSDMSYAVNHLAKVPVIVSVVFHSRCLNMHVVYI